MTPPSPEPVSSWLLLRVWLVLSVQSFGGGGATLALIRREVLERRQWLTEEEFVQEWALCQVAPGINLIAIAILIGRRVAGWRGIILSVVGLLLPSAAVTLLLTAFYAPIRDAAPVKAALATLLPASVGLGLLSAVQMVRPPLIASFREGPLALTIAVGIIAGSAALALTTTLPVIVILLGAGAVGALAGALRR